VKSVERGKRTIRNLAAEGG